MRHEEIEALVREELLGALKDVIEFKAFVDEDYMENAIIKGALVRVIQHYSTPAQLSDLVELMKADP